MPEKSFYRIFIGVLASSQLGACEVYVLHNIHASTHFFHGLALYAIYNLYEPFIKQPLFVWTSHETVVGHHHFAERCRLCYVHPCRTFKTSKPPQLRLMGRQSSVVHSDENNLSPLPYQLSAFIGAQKPKFLQSIRKAIAPLAQQKTYIYGFSTLPLERRRIRPTNTARLFMQH